MSTHYRFIGHGTGHWGGPTGNTGSTGHWTGPTGNTGSTGYWTGSTGDYYDDYYDYYNYYDDNYDYGYDSGKQMIVFKTLTGEVQYFLVQSFTIYFLYIL